MSKRDAVRSAFSALTQAGITGAKVLRILEQLYHSGYKKGRKELVVETIKKDES